MVRPKKGSMAVEIVILATSSTVAYTSLAVCTPMLLAQRSVYQGLARNNLQREGCSLKVSSQIQIDTVLHPEGAAGDCG